MNPPASPVKPKPGTIVTYTDPEGKEHTADIKQRHAIFGAHLTGADCDLGYLENGRPRFASRVPHSENKKSGTYRIPTPAASSSKKDRAPIASTVTD